MPRRPSRLPVFAVAALFVAACDPHAALVPEEASLAKQGGGLQAPSSLLLTSIGETSVDLNWMDNSGSEIAFEVHRSTSGQGGTFTSLGRSGADVPSYSDVPVTPSTQHCYKVRAVGLSGRKESFSGFSNISCATLPAAPSDLSAVALNETDIRLLWTDNALNEASFRIERCKGASCADFVEVATLAANSNVWHDTGLLMGTTYRYRVRSRNGVAYSAYSPVATATTRSSSTLHVVTTTTGIELDPDGYTVYGRERDCNNPCQLLPSTSVPTNGTTTFSGLASGVYLVALSGESPNCTLTGPDQLEVTVNGETTLVIAITCTRTLLSFVSTEAGNAEIYTVKSNGEGVTRLTFDPAFDGDPAWSPDGTRIAFRSERDGNSEIYVMGADGSNPVRLTSNPSGDSRPTWSPDGRRIAFSSGRDGGGIFAMNADGSGVVKLTSDGYAPAWSSDGRIAFAFDTYSFGYFLYSGIYVMNADGTNRVLVAGGENYGGVYLDPAWSPDGGQIALATMQCYYTDPMGCESSLWVMTADGAGFRLLAQPYPFPSDVYPDIRPAFSPDGRMIAFTNSDRIYVVRASGGQPELLTAGTAAAWRR